MSPGTSRKFWWVTPKLLLLLLWCGHDQIGGDGRGNGIGIELWCLILLLDLFALRINIHAMLKLCAVGA